LLLLVCFAFVLFVLDFTIELFGTLKSLKEKDGRVSRREWEEEEEEEKEEEEEGCEGVWVVIVERNGIVGCPTMLSLNKKKNRGR
jgi:hypothetical protein